MHAYSYTMKKQKKIRNIKCKDVINLDRTIARFILPRLKFFKKKTYTYPIGFTIEEWKSTIDKIILAFELILDDYEPDFGNLKYHIEKANNGYWKMVEDPNSTFDKEAYEKWLNDKDIKIKEGLKLFADNFQNLWF